MSGDGKDATVEQERVEPNLDLLGPEEAFEDKPEEAEPEATEQPETEQPEATDEQPSEEVSQGEPESQPEKDQKPDLSQQWDKQLQRISQAAATFEKAAQAFNSNPSDEGRERAERAKSKLDELLEQSDIELDAVKGVRTMAGELKTLSEKATESSEQSEAKIGEVAKRQQRVEEQLFELRFRQTNPDIADRFDKLRETLAEQVKPIAEKGGGQIPEAVWNHIVETHWNQIVEGAKKELESKRSESDKGADKEPAKAPKPRGTQPIQSKSGASRQSPKDQEARLEELLDRAYASYTGGDAG